MLKLLLIEDIEHEHLKLQEKLKRYQNKNIYNLDKTGLFFATNLIGQF